MDSREVFQFDVNSINSVMRELDEIEAEMERRIDKVLTKLANKVITDAKRLAPLDSGDLEAGLIVGVVKRVLYERYIEFGTSPEVDHYATVQHEGFRKTAEGKVLYMSPGEKTKSKRSYKGHIPGKKYLENAIQINERLILEELTAVFSF